MQTRPFFAVACVLTGNFSVYTKYLKSFLKQSLKLEIIPATIFPTKFIGVGQLIAKIILEFPAKDFIIAL